MPKDNNGNDNIKLILFIVEGSSDQRALEEPIAALINVKVW